MNRKTFSLGLLYSATFLFPLLFCFSMVTAQEKVLGNVVDAETRVPLSGVIVIAKDGVKDHTIKFVITDDSGNFMFELPPTKNTILEFQFIGYEKQKVPVRDIPLTLYLKKKQERIEVLDEISIRATRSFLGANKKKILLDAKNYRDSIGNRLEDLLDNIPGISVDSNNGDIYYKNSLIKTVLLDGENIASNNYKQLTQHIDQKIADKVEIITDYTENIVLQSFVNSQDIAINIVSDETYQNKMSGKVDAGYGHEHWYQSKATTLLNKEKQKLLVNMGSQNVNLKPSKINRFDTSSHQNLSLSNYHLELQAPLSSLAYEQQILSLPNIGIVNELTNHEFMPNLLFKINKNQSFLVNYAKGSFVGENKSSTHYRSFFDQFQDFENNLTTNYRDVMDKFDVQYDALIEKKIQLRSYFSQQSTLQKSISKGLLSNENFNKSDRTKNHHFNLGVSMSARLAHKQAFTASYSQTNDSQDETVSRISDRVFPFFNLGTIIHTSQIHQDRVHQNRTHYLALNYAYKLNTKNLLDASYFFHNMKQEETYMSELLENQFPGHQTNALAINSFQLRWKYIIEQFSSRFTLAKVQVRHNTHSSAEFIPNVSLNYNDRFAWDVSVNYGRYLPFSPLKNQTKLSVYTSSFLVNQLFYDVSIPSLRNQLTFHLNKAWPRSHQQTSFFLNKETENQHYIRTQTPVELFIFQENRFEKNKNERAALLLSHNVYLTKIKSFTEVAIDWSSNNFESLVNNVRWNNSIESYTLNFTYKSFFKFPINFIIAANYNQNAYNQKREGESYDGKWNQFSLRNTAKFKIVPKKKEATIHYVHYNYGNGKVDLLNGSVAWRGFLKNIDFNILFYNLLNEKTLLTESFQANYLISQGQHLNRRAILFELSYFF